jgi:hypothetical protein
MIDLWRGKADVGVVSDRVLKARESKMKEWVLGLLNAADDGTTEKVKSWVLPRRSCACEIFDGMKYCGKEWKKGGGPAWFCEREAKFVVSKSAKTERSQLESFWPSCTHPHVRLKREPANFSSALHEEFKKEGRGNADGIWEKMKNAQEAFDKVLANPENWVAEAKLVQRRDC